MYVRNFAFIASEVTSSCRQLDADANALHVDPIHSSTFVSGDFNPKSAHKFYYGEPCEETTPHARESREERFLTPFGNSLNWTVASRPDIIAKTTALRNWT